MLQRCYRTRNKDWPRYGGRGITVCDEWRTDFRSFLSDVGRRPTARHSLDRIDNEGPYEPGNCRWATPEEQANNKRDSRFLEWDGRRMTVTEWERLRGVRAGTFKRRLYRGWAVQDILTTPVAPDPLYTYQGRTQDLSKWAREIGLPLGTLRKRILLGWTLQRAMTEPVNTRFQHPHH